MSKYCMPCTKLYKVQIIEDGMPNPCVVYKTADVLVQTLKTSMKVKKIGSHLWKKFSVP